MTSGRRHELRQKLRTLGLCWCVLVGIAGSIGGLVTILNRDNDDALGV